MSLRQDSQLSGTVHQKRLSDYLKIGDKSGHVTSRLI